MVYLDILGRCGNQMFQYAFAKRIAEIQNDSITINYSLLESYRAKYGNSFCNELSGFKASDTFIETDSSALRIKEFGSFKQRIIYRVYSSVRKLLGKLNKDPHIAEKAFRHILALFGIYLDCLYPEKPFRVKKRNEKNIFIKGYFENPLYLTPIAEELRLLYSPKNPLSPVDESFLQQIKNSDSVCVSFRKWEVDGRDICNEEYYKKAIEIIKQRVNNPLFVIFSNDIPWVKENFSVPDNCIFESGTNSIPEKIALMSACKHSIITNSTFCWWTQFLSDNPDKIVIMPEHWFENENSRHPLTSGDYILL